LKETAMIGAAVEMKQTICNAAWWMLAESRAKPKS